MSKYDIGVGEAFELDEGQPQDDCGARHGRHHRHDHHGHHHAHLTALAMLFALKAYRQHRRSHAEDRDFS